MGSEILILKSFEQEWNIRCFVARRVEECVTVVEKSFNVEKDNNEDKRPGEIRNDQGRCGKIARVEQKSPGETRSEQSSNNVTMIM